MLSRARAAPLRFFGVCVLVTFLNFALWSVASPLFASPDEPAHVVHAVAAVRGEFVGRTVRSASNATTAVTVPEVFASSAAYPDCFAFRPSKPASCARPLATSTKVVSTTTYVGRYPPFYYLVVGLPSLFAVSETGVYLMRLVSAMLNAVLVSLALLSIALWSRRRMLFVALVVAMTPMAWFLGGVVNPNGLEISAAVCLWCSGAVLVLERAEDPPPGLVWIFAAATAALLLARNLSPLWVAVIFVLLAMLGGRNALRTLLANRLVRWSAVSLAPVAGFALWWIVAQHALDLTAVGAPIPAGEGSLHVLVSLFANTGQWLDQMIGVFGWLDTNSPFLTYLLFFFVIGLLALLALACAKPRQLGALALLVLAVIVVPVAISYGQAHRLGVIWQGRYILPLAAGVPIVAASLIDQSGVLTFWRTRVTVALCLCVGVADLAAFGESLRRYVRGVPGPLDFLSGKWQPPLGSLAVSVVYLISLGALLSMIVYLVASEQSRRAVRRERKELGLLSERPVDEAPVGLPRVQEEAPS